MYKVVFQTTDFYLINKQAGVSVHRDELECGLLDRMRQQLGDKQLYLIHRLDKMTSGLLLIGRNKQAASILSQLFANRQVEKYYLAISGKKPKKKQGVVIGDMAQGRRSGWKLISSKENPAITQFYSLSVKAGERLFLCRPHTGKTHQIRVALKSVGSPILGDETYAGAKADRGYLHAYSLSFNYLDKAYCFVEIPDDGEHWPTKEQLAEWANPIQLPWPKLNK
ncbi:TIGR01621 family pseudouridine synthase [Vibrio sp. SS-MA-C1-2]|uniref:TIGR01621 family pseudouridine synthase n=1 Tax=Vibrio sp. SS-MA-C1-2 TaxID=2908646 RepID=UPI001F2DCBEA|nr:TIGR01621 family pseudouridine synthase [Vibrio sp. SS-MA-C1-2]UJF19929.1 TIGR01621 family pseudouridine synthase [Vibrio sp. SS-MA-C1-2]